MRARPGIAYEEAYIIYFMHTRTTCTHTHTLKRAKRPGSGRHKKADRQTQGKQRQTSVEYTHKWDATRLPASERERERERERESERER